MIEINKRAINNRKTGPVTKKLTEEFAKLVRDPSFGVPIYVSGRA